MRSMIAMSFSRGLASCAARQGPRAIRRPPGTTVAMDQVLAVIAPVEEETA